MFWVFWGGFGKGGDSQPLLTLPRNATFINPRFRSFCGVIIGFVFDEGYYRFLLYDSGTGNNLYIPSLGDQNLYIPSFKHNLYIPSFVPVGCTLNGILRFVWKK